MFSFPRPIGYILFTSSVVGGAYMLSSSVRVLAPIRRGSGVFCLGFMLAHRFA